MKYKKINAVMALTGLCMVMLTLGCSKRDQHSQDMSKGSGTYNIDEYTVITYDSTGAETSKDMRTDMGELLFFRQGSYDALFDYRTMVYLKNMGKDSVVAYPGQFVRDYDQLTMENLPEEIVGIWYIEKEAFGKMTLTIALAGAGRSNNAKSLGQKRTMILNKK